MIEAIHDITLKRARERSSSLADLLSRRRGHLGRGRSPLLKVPPDEPERRDRAPFDHPVCV